MGSGIFVSELGISYGVEPSLDRAAAARKKGIRVYHGVAENPPVEEAAYQYALMVTVDCFLSDLPRAFSEVWRILNDGGIFVIAVLDRATPLGEEYEKNKHKYKSYRDASFHSAEEIIRCLEEVGFTVTGKQQTVYSLENSF